MDNSSNLTLIVWDEGRFSSTQSVVGIITQHINQTTTYQQKSSGSRDTTINLCQTVSFHYWVAIPIRVLLVRIVHVERGLFWNHTERKEREETIVTFNLQSDPDVSRPEGNVAAYHGNLDSNSLQQPVGQQTGNTQHLGANNFTITSGGSNILAIWAGSIHDVLFLSPPSVGYPLQHHLQQRILVQEYSPWNPHLIIRFP